MMPNPIDQMKGQMSIEDAKEIVDDSDAMQYKAFNMSYDQEDEVLNANWVFDLNDTEMEKEKALEELRNHIAEGEDDEHYSMDHEIEVEDNEVDLSLRFKDVGRNISSIMAMQQFLMDAGNMQPDMTMAFISQELTPTILPKIAARQKLEDQGVIGEDESPDYIG